MDVLAHYTDGKKNWVEHHVGFKDKQQAWRVLKKRYPKRVARVFWMEDAGDLGHDWEVISPIHRQCKCCGIVGEVSKKKYVRIIGKVEYVLFDFSCKESRLLQNTKFQNHFVASIRKEGFEKEKT